MNTNRAYSTIVVKAVDEDTREIRGVASTPSTDRMGDIVDPNGAMFSLPMPFLWQHMHDAPIGSVIRAKITDAGLEIVAKLVAPTADMPSQMIARLQEAWSSIKSALVRGLSIGFRPIEYSFLDEGGVRFLKYEIFEISAVTIPANSEASITNVKSFDKRLLAASGITQDGVVRLGKPTPGVSGIQQTRRSGAVTSIPEGAQMATKTIGEQITAFESTRQAKAAAMSDIMTKSSDEGRTLDSEEAQGYDTLKGEVKSIDEHLARLRDQEKMQISAAKAVDGTSSRGASDSRTLLPVQVKNTQKLEPGLLFARAAKCLALGHLEHRDAIQIAKSLYDGQDSVIGATQRLVTKAAVAPATTANSSWAGALVGEEGTAFADFVAWLRPMTILGRFGLNGVPALRRVPFRTPLIGQTSGGDGYWVGEGNAKPLTKFDFSRTTLEPLKVANIAVATMEVIRDSSPAADTIIRDALAAALRERLDIDFIDPEKAAVASISPASILNGVTGIASSGTDAEAVRTDIKAVFGAFIAANNAPTSGVWIMSSTTALALSLMQNPLGQAEFPGIGMNGGTLFSLPVIVSEYVPFDSSGAIVALVNASDIYLGDEGEIDLSMSTEASLQMDSAPDNPSTATTVMVSLWQRNLVGFRAERTVSWARRRPSAVAYLTGVNWG